MADEAAAASEPYTVEELAKFTSIVKEAVGFNELRGDRVTVTNLAFKQPEALGALPEIPLLEQAWVLDAAKQAVGAIFVLILVFVVLKPTIQKLLEKPTVAGLSDGSQVAVMASGGAQGGVAQSGGDTPLGLESDEELMLLEAPKSYEQRLEMAQKIAGEDPKRVAQVMKTWIQ